MTKINNADIVDNKMKILIRGIGLCKKYIPWYVLICVLTVLSSSASIFVAAGLKTMIDGAVSKSADVVYSGVLLLLTVAILVQPLLDGVRNYSSALINNKTSQELQQKLIIKFTKLSISHIRSFGTRDIITRVLDNAGSLQEGLNKTLIEIINMAFILIFTYSYVAVSNIRITLGILITVITLPLLNALITKSVNKKIRKQKELESRYMAFCQDSLQGAEVVKTFSLTNVLAQKSDDIYKGYVQLEKAIRQLISCTYFISILTRNSTVFIIMVYGGYLAIEGEITIGSVAAFLTIAGNMVWPFRRISELWVELQDALASGSRVIEFVDMPEMSDVALEDGNFTIGDICFKNVSFNYNIEEEVLKNINFTCNNKEMTAIVGKSGSGKTTVANLLMRMYDPNTGSISCGGTDISKISRSLWYKQIAYVSQEPCIYSGTVLHNIALGKPGATLEEVRAAAELANIDDFIESLPQKYNTQVGERGIKLSGGERQRIEIARAILKNPKILILDEPTSSLDSENEKIISDALKELMNGRTTIVIAHRLSTIRDADNIVVINSGEVCEIGKHSSLIENRGRYFELYSAFEKGAVI